jgi:predicted phosphoribosyltransferase
LLIARFIFSLLQKYHISSDFLAALDLLWIMPLEFPEHREFHQAAAIPDDSRYNLKQL